LTIYNASSSQFTLTAMTYIALAVPFVIAYIAYVWRAMDSGKMSVSDISSDKGHDFY
jgi:cytochrome d ubiquinol oxidase subunit II